MMKIITTEQIQALKNDIYRLNPPVQIWEAMVRFFDTLPGVEEAKKDEKEKK